jgi:hypothetical protein
MPRKTRKAKLARLERKKLKSLRANRLSPWERFKAEARLARPRLKNQTTKTDLLRRVKNYLTLPSKTIFGSRRARPLWQSVLCDGLCVGTLGFYRP